MTKITTLLMLGMGSIQKSLIELIKIDKNDLINLDWICICPENIPEYIFKIKPDLHHCKLYLKDNNIDEILNDLISDSVFVIDLTIDVDSIKVMKICKEKNALYINSSLEQYENTKPEGNDIEKTTLYYQEKVLEKELSKVKGKHKQSQLHSFGANPGAISSIVYYGIYEYCKKYHKDKLKLLKKGKFDIVCREILEMIHVSEIDTQEVSMKAKKNWMINSWSAHGYVEEALDNSFLASPIVFDGYKRSKINKHLIYSTKHSMDVKCNSVSVNHDGSSHYYEGLCITHFETVSLSDYLGIGDYTPIISYVYKSSPISRKCLDYMRDNNYKKPKNYYVFNQKDVVNKDSFDSMGCSLYFKEKDGTMRVWWCGTSLSNNQTLELGFEYSTCTQLQVSMSVLCGIEWIMKHRNEEVITGEEIPFNYVINRCKPYWGNFICKEMN